MKRLIFTLVLLLVLPIGAGADDLFATGAVLHQTEHFSFETPSDWINESKDGNFSFRTNPFDESTGMAVNISEYDYSMFSSFGTDAIYDSVIDAVMKSLGDPQYAHRSLSKDGVTARLISFTDSSHGLKFKISLIVYCVDGYTLTCMATTSGMSPKELESSLISMFDRVICTLPHEGIEYADYDFRMASRYPDEYMGTFVRLSGKVLQVIRTKIGSYHLRVATSGSYDDVVYVDVLSSSAPPYRILEDDIVFIEGMALGEETYGTVSGSTVTIPLVVVDSISVEGQ